MPPMSCRFYVIVVYTDRHAFMMIKEQLSYEMAISIVLPYDASQRLGVIMIFEQPFTGLKGVLNPNFRPFSFELNKK